VFSYLGLTFFSYKSYEWSYELIVVEMVVIMIGRALGTFGLISLLKICKYEKHNRKAITWKELTFIWYAGLIRGAIAFGLVLRIDDSVPNRGVIVTTCLTLVVFTTIFFGSTVGVLGKCMFGEKARLKTRQRLMKMTLTQLAQILCLIPHLQIHLSFTHPWFTTMTRLRAKIATLTRT